MADGISSILTMSLMVKLGSIAVHVDEYLDSEGTPAGLYDAATVRSLLQDPEVIEWMAKMDAQSLLPKKRQPGGVRNHCEHGKGLTDYCLPCGRINGSG